MPTAVPMAYGMTLGERQVYQVTTMGERQVNQLCASPTTLSPACSPVSTQDSFTLPSIDPYQYRDISLIRTPHPLGPL